MTNPCVRTDRPFYALYNQLFIVAVLLLFTGQLWAQPVISGFNPKSGGAGASVAITGTNFSATAANNIVYFGAVKASVTAATTTSLAVTVPPGALYAPITVTTGDKTASTATPFTMTFSGNGWLDNATVYPATTVSVYKGFQTIAAGDFDGDGRPDLAVCNTVGNYIMIYPNSSASKQFALNTAGAIQVNTGTGPASLAVGDIDGDGKLDIVVANGSGTVSILLNTSTAGAMSFAPKFDITTPGIPSGVAIGDLDGNGTQDLVVTGSENYTNSRCYVYDNYSTVGVIHMALYQTLTSYPVQPCSPSIVDIDGDGKRDIIYPNFNGNSFTVFLNNSGGNYISLATQAYNFGSGSALSNLSIADIDGDGKQDVLLVSGYDSTVQVYPNTSTVGTAAFGSPVLIRITGITNQVVAGDFDGDGKPDIEAVNSFRLVPYPIIGPGVVRDSSINSISLIKNLSTPGNFKFNTPATVVTGKGPMGLVFGDFNLDNIADVVTVDSADGTIGFVEYRTDTSQVAAPSFTPSSARAGTTVTISGGNFSGVTGVSFGGVAATSFTVVSPTSITAIVGNGATGNIAVAASSGTITIPGFTYIPPGPVVGSFTPTSGATGTTVTIYGYNFTTATAVKSGDSTAASFTVTSDTSITAVVGPVIAGSLAVSVATTSGIATSSGAVFYTGPAIKSFTPQSGAVGSTVIITGAGFSTTPANNIVFFGSELATVTSATATSLTVTVPTGASYQSISVTTNGLTSFTDLPFSITFPGASQTFSTTQFGAAVTNATSRVPYSVIASDLDGDGMVDVAVVNVGDQNISLFRNRGLLSNGQVYFHTVVDIGAASGAIFLAVSDLNGDGRPELITVNNGCGNSGVSIYKNASSAGNFSFGAPLTYPTGLGNCSQPSSVTITDLDGDGRPDMVIANTDNTITIYHNTGVNGSLSFTGAGNYPAGSAMASSIIAGDLDGDGRPDLVITPSNADFVTIYRNTSVPGVISLQSEANVSTGSGPYAAAIGDLNGDGKPDLAVVTANALTLTVFQNTSTNGVISFADSLTYNMSPSSPRGVAITDLDGDGKPDVAVMDPTPHYVNGTNYYYVEGYKNTTGNGGKITLQPAINFTSGNGMNAFCIADVTGDGLPDIVTTNINDYTFSVLPNQTQAPHINSFTPLRGGQGTVITIKGQNFTNTSSVIIGFEQTPASTFTVISDSVITAVVPAAYSGNLVVTTPKGKGTLGTFSFTHFATVNAFTPAAGPEGTILQVTGSNFDPVSGNNSVYLGAVKGVVTASTANTLTVKVPAGTSYQPLTVYADSVAAIPVQPFVLSWPGGGFIDSTSFAGRTDYTVESAPAAFSFADLDGDGYPDLVTTSKGNGISVYHNKGRSDTLLYDAAIDYLTGTSPVNIVVQDLDGDGKPDMLVSNLTAGTVSIFRNTSTAGNISFAAKLDISGTIASPFSFVVTDLDGDGKPDIAVLNGIQNGSFVLYQNSSSVGRISFTQYPYPYSTGTNPKKIVAGDMDGDGLPDLAVINSSDGTLVVFHNNGLLGFTVVSTLSTPAAPSGLALGDLDGDGRPDLAVTGSSDNVLSLYSNTSSPGALSFAARTDIAANPYATDIEMGDLDGDGKVDLAVASATGNEVSVFKNFSSPGFFSFGPKVDYATGNYPEQVFIGDLHNSGKNDLAVVDNLSNIVSIYKYQTSVHPKPIILGFTPDSAAAGQTISITGKFFSTASAVSFGSKSASSFLVRNDTLITAVLDSGATGAVIVSGPDGADTVSGFTYIAPVTPPPVPVAPKITSFSPTSGGKGDTVTIVGSKFTGVTSVLFGKQSAASFVVVADSVIYAVVDTGATGAVIVSGPNGADTASGFTFIASVTPPPVSVSPKISSFSPTSGGKGDTVMILGIHLDTVSNITFGGTPAQSFHILNDSSIIAIVSGGSTGSVALLSSAGNDSLAGFTFDTTATVPATPPDTTTQPATAAFGLVQFTGSVAGNQPVLQWKAQNDQLVAYYGIEQGTDTVHWNTVGFVRASEQDSASYSFTDSGRSGLNFYRLSVVDSKDDSTYSWIVPLQMTGVVEPLTIYPNPVRNGYIMVNVPVITSPSHFQMVDMAGNVVESVEVAPGVYQVRITVTAAMTGVYKVIWRNGKQATYQNILILR